MRILLLVAIGLIISIAVYALLDFARDRVFETAVPRRRGGAPPLWTPFEGLGRLRFLNQFLVYVAILAAGFARTYFLRDQIRGREAVALEARAARLQAHAEMPATIFVTEERRRAVGLTGRWEELGAKMGIHP